MNYNDAYIYIYIRMNNYEYMYMAEWDEFTDLKLAEVRTLEDDPLTKHQWIRNMNGSVNNKVSGDIMNSLGIT